MNADWIYLDNNATTAPSPEEVQVMADTLLTCWANASSSHAAGQQAKQVLMKARGQVAALMGCKPAEVVFTSGATEANHMVLRGLQRMAPSNERRALVISSAEHAGHQKLARELAQSLPVRWIALQADGSLNPADAEAQMGADVAVLSVMAANNETGALMPLRELAEMAHRHGALLHVDATQLIGKLPFHFGESGADMVSLSAHKFHGPKGVGALIIKQGLSWPVLFVGSQERARRGGTENLPGIVGMGVAAEACKRTAEAWAAHAAHLATLRDTLEQGLLARLPGTHVFSGSLPAGQRLPNTSYLRFGHVHADAVLHKLDRLGVMASSGSACSSGGNEPPPVLLAMGVPGDEALCAIRLTLSGATTAADIASVLERLPPELAPLMQADGSTATAPPSPSSPSTTGVFA